MQKSREIINGGNNLDLRYKILNQQRKPETS